MLLSFCLFPVIPVEISKKIKIRRRISDKSKSVYSMTPIFAPAPHVLVASGSRALDLGMAKMLSPLGYPAQSAKDNAEALRVLMKPNAPGIAMLGESGLDLAAEVKRRADTKQTWIILLTRNADPRTIALAAEAGVDDLLLCYPGRDEEPVGKAELRIRLEVATRVQQMSQELRLELSHVGHQPGPRAARDPLTGLWDRESLLTLLFPETDRVQRMGTPLTFMLLDLDYFGRINEEYGVETGDQILHELATRLRRYLRSYDLLGRSGGDEFLAALPGCNSVQAIQLAGRIRSALLQRPFVARNDVVTLTASIGLAQSRGRSPLVALREAERALAAAKSEGGNREREFSSSSAISSVAAFVQ